MPDNRFGGIPVEEAGGRFGGIPVTDEPQQPISTTQRVRNYLSTGDTNKSMQQGGTPLSANHPLVRMGNAAGEWLSPSALAAPVAHPYGTLRADESITRQNARTAAEDFKQGNYRKAAIHALGAIPVLGPPLSQLAEESTSGRIPEAIGHAGAAALVGRVAGDAMGNAPEILQGAREVPGTVRSMAQGASEGLRAPDVKVRSMPKAAIKGAIKGFQNRPLPEPVGGNEPIPAPTYTSEPPIGWPSGTPAPSVTASGSPAYPIEMSPEALAAFKRAHSAPVATPHNVPPLREVLRKAELPAPAPEPEFVKPEPTYTDAPPIGMEPPAPAVPRETGPSPFPDEYAARQREIHNPTESAAEMAERLQAEVATEAEAKMWPDKLKSAMKDLGMRGKYENLLPVQQKVVHARAQQLFNGQAPPLADITKQPLAAPAPAPSEVAPKAEAPALKASSEAPAGPLHHQAEVVENFSTKRKVLNLTRHFLDEGKTWDELNAMHEKAKATGDWGNILKEERNAWNSGRGVESGGGANQGTFVPENPYRASSTARITKGAYKPAGEVKTTWELLLEGYPKKNGTLAAPR